MLNVFICEDIEMQGMSITKYVEEHIENTDYNMEIVISTNDPDKIIDCAKTSVTTGIYFLDMDLNHAIGGLGMALEIRRHDVRGFIVLISTNDEILPLTYKYKVEALDYIVKDDEGNVKNRICECIDDAWGKYARCTISKIDVERRVIYSAGKKLEIPYGKILFFEKVEESNSIYMYYITNNGYGRHKFRGILNQIEGTLNDKFIRCHQTFIINIYYVEKFDIVRRIVHMEYFGICPVARRKVKELREALLSIGKQFN